MLMYKYGNRMRDSFVGALSFLFYVTFLYFAGVFIEFETIIPLALGGGDGYSQL